MNIAGDNLASEEQVKKYLSGIQVEDSTSFFTLDTASQPNPNKLIISGKTKNNTLLGLWHNGKFVQSEVARDNKYQFDPTLLWMGENVFKIFRLDPRGKAVLVDSMVIHYTSRRISQNMKSVSSIRTQDRILSLTFDGGSGTNGAETILQILKEHDIQTSFFLTGRFIKKNKYLTSKIINDGHEIGNHTYTHPHFTQFESNGKHITIPQVTRELLYKELLGTDSVFYAYFKRHLTPLWRAPFGEFNTEILQWAAEIGFRHIKWSRYGDTMDWVRDEQSELYRSSEQIYDHIMEMEAAGKLNGSILLMHFGTDRESDFPYLMLPKLIEDLEEKNYTFLRITDLLNYQSAK